LAGVLCIGAGVERAGKKEEKKEVFHAGLIFSFS